MEDNILIKAFHNQMKKHKQISLRNEYESLENYEKDKNINLSDKGLELRDERFRNILIEGFERVSPLIYLNQEQKKEILDRIKMFKFFEKHLLYSGMDDITEVDTFCCFILIEGEIHFFDNKKRTFVDLINDVCFFGYDGPIFGKRFNTVLVEKDSVIGVLEKSDFLHILKPFSQFATFISRNIRYKDKVLDPLTQFKNFILSSRNKGPINVALLLKYYRSISSLIHRTVNQEDIDFNAWNYALKRLPTNIFETFVFVMINKIPQFLSLNELSNKYIEKVMIQSRSRDCYKYLDGKVLVLVRDDETDVIDFICNLCIHIIESTKMRKLILSPLTVQRIYEQKDNVEGTLDIIQNLLGNKINLEEINLIKNSFGDNLAQKLLNLSLHYQDYSIQNVEEFQIDRDPIENLIQNLLISARKLLGITTCLEETEDLVVDIIKGSKKTLVSFFSPHIYKEKDLILKWARESNLSLKINKFDNETDELLAYSYYYYTEFPEKQLEKEAMEKEYGMCFINKTFSTGTKVLLINPNKLHKDFHHPEININPSSKNHLILYIGYTIGAQSYHIIKPLLMLFGNKARSLNIVGKAEGLVGNTGDILVPDRMFLSKNHELSIIDYGNFHKEDLEISNKSNNIHIGPMLTVAGTILQNKDILNFYKHVMGCIGLEMEGFYFCKEIENCIKHGILRKNFVTRCLYHLTALPLEADYNTLVSKESTWEEGIGSMKAIQGFVLNQIFK